MKIKRMKIIWDEQGGSLVEFVIIAPLLFLILFGIIEFGILLYNQAVITNASREGARYGIVARGELGRHTVSEITAVVTTYCDNLITFAAPSDPSVSAIPVDGPDDNTTPTDFSDNLPVEVSWSHTFLVLPNLPGIGLSNPFPLSARTVMKYE